AGIDGPYGLALGPEVHTRVLETSEHGGYPLLQHLREILGGPVAWAPAVHGAAVLSMRGGDFLFDRGQDLAIGYEAHGGGAGPLRRRAAASAQRRAPSPAAARRPGARR